MSNLYLTKQWHENINQVEVTEPILGGDGGNANLATRQLGENILFVKGIADDNKKGLSDHEAADNPHSQYALQLDYLTAIEALHKRIDELSKSAGVGTVLGRLDLTFSGAKNTYNAQQSIDNVRYSAYKNGDFNFVLSSRFNNNSIGEVVCRYGDASLTLSLYYPEGFDESLHEIRSNKTYVTRSDGKGISFTLSYSSQKEEDSNFYKYSISAGFYFEIVKK